jgi:hypothetical protein
MPDLVAIASNLDLREACLARTRLEGSGIRCFLANEFVMHTHAPALVFAVGGVELRVMEYDVPAAIEVLTGKEFDGACEPDAFPAMARSCPQCKHTRVARKRSPGWLTRIVLTLCMWGVVFGLPRDGKTCLGCGHKWE